jgi:hypothetical protein
MKQLKTKSREASVLRQRRYQLVRRFGVPEELVGGSLSQCRRRCGKPNCHCAEGSGHAQWSLTFSRGGVRRVEKVPAHWVADLEKAVAGDPRSISTRSGRSWPSTSSCSDWHGATSGNAEYADATRVVAAVVDCSRGFAWTRNTELACEVLPSPPAPLPEGEGSEVNSNPPGAGRAEQTRWRAC